MEENEIIGMSVMVSTLLYNDPYNKQGEIGMIFRVDMPADDYYVRFGDHTEGLYAANSLHILKSPEELWKIILGQNGVNLTEAEQDHLRKIAILLEYGGEKSKLTAYRLTAGNDAAEFFATSTLEYLLGMRDIKRAKSMPHYPLPEKITDQKLVGTWVLVDPLPWNAPLARHGQIGKIISSDRLKNAFTIQFDDESTGSYSSNELNIPKTADDISDYANKHAKEADAISHEFRERMHDYASHIEHRGEKALRESLEFVQKNPFFQVWLTDSLDHVLAMRPADRIGR